MTTKNNIEVEPREKYLVGCLVRLINIKEKYEWFDNSIYLNYLEGIKEGVELSEDTINKILFHADLFVYNKHLPHCLMD